MTRTPGPTYYVEPNPLRAGRWRILKIEEGCNLGLVIAGDFKTRKEAMTTAGLLAGWRGSVVLVQGRRKAA